MVLLGVYACGKIRRGVSDRNERREFNELLLHCDSDGLVDRKLLKLSTLWSEEFRDNDKKLLLFKSIGVRERGNESFGITFDAFKNVDGCDKSLDVEFGVIFLMDFGTFGGNGGRGTTNLSPFSPFDAEFDFVWIILGLTNEFIDSFTKSLTIWDSECGIFSMLFSLIHLQNSTISIHI